LHRSWGTDIVPPVKVKKGVAPKAGGGRGDRTTRAYTELRQMIIHGRLAPGVRVIENDIAERLGVSRTPVRSALHRLEQEGYIVSVGWDNERRLMVAPMTEEDVLELFQIVAEIEGLAARLAAKHPPKQRAALVAKLRRINEELAAAGQTARPDPARYFELDLTFHRTLVEFGAGPRLIALHDAIKPQSERYNTLYTSALMTAVDTSVSEHEAIVRAIEAGKGHAADAAVQKNWWNAAERLSTVIASLNERGLW
jgi:DNA-binding GntR family transcriptional regulator